jgi:pimeloyl-ACP methyl ester carboxylesterase
MTTDMHVTTWGSGPRVVLVHGGAQGGPASGDQQWSGQQPLADRGFGLLVPDRPGHGQSPSRGPEDLEIDAVWVALVAPLFSPPAPTSSGTPTAAPSRCAPPACAPRPRTRSP